MGRISKSLKLILIAAFLLVSAVSFFDFDSGFFGSENRSYQELDLQVEARILPDGSMLVRETRILEFKGDFSRYRRQIPHQGYGQILEVKASEPNRPYTKTNDLNGRPEGRFATSKAQVSGIDQDIIELFFQAHDQKRTFIIEYRLTDVVKVHNDVAELDWKFIGAGRSLPIGSMSVNLTLPEGSSTDALKVWGHGPLKGTVQKINGSQLSWQTTNLPKDRFLEGRVAFPPTLVPQATKRTNKAALPAILAEEQRWADQRAQEQREALYIVAGSIGVGLIGILTSFLIYFLFGRKYKSAIEVEYYRELPGTYSPAEAGCLVENNVIKPQAIAATFMDLARRGYLRMEPAHNSESEDILVHHLKPAGADLAPHERLLLEFFFNRVGAMQSQVWFSALKIYRKAEPAATAAFISSFQSCVKTSVAAMGYFQSTNRARSIAGIGFCVGLAGLIISWAMVWLYFAAAFAVVCASMLAALLISRSLTPAGQQQFDLWQAFRRFLKDFSNLEHAQIPQLILWEHYLVYAVVLGVAKEVIKQLPIVYPQLNEPNSNFAPYWGGMYHTSYGSDGLLHQTSFAGLNSFSEIVDSMQTTWSDAYSSLAASSISSISNSSGGGDGGGFSGGGGGGGGGGSGDAD